MAGMTKKSFFRHLAVELFASFIVGAAAALTMKADIGLGSWDALTMSLAMISGIRVGTIGMTLNISCALLQIILMKRDYKPILLLQLVYSWLLGLTVNLFYYDIFASLTFSSYIMRLLALLAGTVILAFAVGLTMSSGMVGYPLEGSCLQVGKKINRPFAKVRQDVDFICIFIILILYFFFDGPLSIREGTVIFAVLFGPLMGWNMKYMAKYIPKWCEGKTDKQD